MKLPGYTSLHKEEKHTAQTRQIMSLHQEKLLLEHAWLDTANTPSVILIFPCLRGQPLMSFPLETSADPFSYLKLGDLRTDFSFMLPLHILDPLHSFDPLHIDCKFLSGGLILLISKFLVEISQ